MTMSMPAASSCPNKALYTVVDRSNLIFPPDTQTTVYSITGDKDPITGASTPRSTVMIGTTEGSKLYLPPDSTVRVGATAAGFVFNEGGTVEIQPTVPGQQPALPDGGSLSLFPPATIGGRLDTQGYATNYITLTGGGLLQTPSGNSLGSILPGTTQIVSPVPDLNYPQNYLLYSTDQYTYLYFIPINAICTQSHQCHLKC